MGKPSIPLAVVLLLCFLVSFSEAEYRKYKDPKVPLNERIRDLIKRMTLEEKIGQMTQIERSVATPDVMKKYFLGKPLIRSLLISSTMYSKCLMDLCKGYLFFIVLL